VPSSEFSNCFEDDRISIRLDHTWNLRIHHKFRFASYTRLAAFRCCKLNHPLLFIIPPALLIFTTRLERKGNRWRFFCFFAERGFLHFSVATFLGMLLPDLRLRSASAGCVIGEVIQRCCELGQNQSPLCWATTSRRFHLHCLLGCMVMLLLWFVSVCDILMRLRYDVFVPSGQPNLAL